jgi:UDP-N-acetylmuramoyl-tripeptide--D-alanyl-D-alanine ligase
VVSNVAAVHLEFFADGIEGIARAKYELIEALPENGVAVLNGDDERVAEFGRGMGDRAVLYGTREDAAVRAVNIEECGLNGNRFGVVVSDGRCAMALRLPGSHNVLNAMAAIAVGVRSGIELASCCEALSRMRPTERRGNAVQWRGSEIVNDTYNSNPQALLAMMEALRRTPATRRIVVAGEMLELGTEAGMLHARCGVFAAEAGIDVVVGVRGWAKELVEAARLAGVVAHFVDTPELAGEWLRENLRDGDVVLLKASRGVRLERALAALQRKTGDLAAQG